MVKFSDLEKGNLNPKKNHEKDSGERSRPSGMSFRDLEKETGRITSREAGRPKEVSDEERKAVYDTAKDYLTSVLDAVRKRHRFALEPGEEIVRRITEFQSPVDPLLIRAIYQDNPQGYLINHCINVTVFSIKMATALGLSKFEQEQVGLAALLHEVGMGVIPEKLIYKEQKLAEQEYAIFKKRPEFAYKILKGFGDKHAFLAETALQVHECMDGSGYPLGLSGDEIHVYAQIIGLVDMYEALIHSRPQRNKFPHFSAVKQIIKTGKRRYPKKHLKALLNTFSLFPMHSLVKLNSNTVGRVIQTYPDQPMRPKIEVVFDSQGRQVLAGQVINLAENSILYIVDSVSENNAKGMAPGPGAKPYPQTPAPAPYDREPAIILDIADIDGEAPRDADILEITEDDFEPSPPATARERLEPDRNRFIFRSKEVAEDRDELIAAPVQISVPEKGRRAGWYKFILLAAVIVVLAVIALWQLGLMDFLLKKSDSPGMSVKTSEKKAAKAVDKKVLKEKTQPAPAPVKGPAPSSPKQALSENPPASAAGMPADAIKVLTPLAQPIIDKSRAEVAAGLKPGGVAAEALKVRGGSYPFSIKLDSFRTSQEAQAALAAYSAKGLNAYWVKANLGSQGIWYRVFAGCYPTRQQAEAVIQELGLKDAVARETKYAALIGTFSSRAAMDQKVKWLSDKGYSAYVIPDGENTFNLFVGAFYTRKGIEEQFADLRSDDIQSQIVER